MRSEREYWWRFGDDNARALLTPFAAWSECWLCSQVSQHLCIRIPASQIVFLTTARRLSHLRRTRRFCVLQSRVHEVWARFFASSMKDDLRYTPSDCFETFPFPPNFETDPALEAAGQAYYEFRAALMVRNNEGLTKTYNRFHDPDERSPDILKLRELHAAMDRAVLDAYGWTDLKPTCEFLLDYEEDEDEDEPAEAAAARSPGATAGPTTSATKSSPASWNSTASGPRKSA